MQQRHLIASIRIESFNAVGLVQVATRTGPGEVVQLRMSTAGLGDHMLDVKRGTLERLMHTTVFTTSCSSGLDVSLTFPTGHHAGFRPSKCRAVARISASWPTKRGACSAHTHQARVFYSLLTEIGSDDFLHPQVELCGLWGSRVNGDVFEPVAFEKL